VNFIIYDLEATCWQGNNKMQQEIIEIGAIKFNGYGEADSIFSSFVRPVIHPTLSAYCTELTTITQVDVNRADKFPIVVEAFQDWIDIFEEDYLLCAWGSFDKKALIHDCTFHDMDSEWAEKYINLKRQYHEIKGFRHPIGLKKAIHREGFEFTGAQHRGIDDAKNLAKIWMKYIDEWMY